MLILFFNDYHNPMSEVTYLSVLNLSILQQTTAINWERKLRPIISSIWIALVCFRLKSMMKEVMPSNPTTMPLMRSWFFLILFLFYWGACLYLPLDFLAFIIFNYFLLFKLLLSVILYMLKLLNFEIENS